MKGLLCVWPLVFFQLFLNNVLFFKEGNSLIINCSPGWRFVLRCVIMNSLLRKSETSYYDYLLQAELDHNVKCLFICL